MLRTILLILAVCLTFSSGGYQKAASKLQKGIIGSAGRASLYSQNIQAAPMQQKNFYRPSFSEQLPTVPECQDVKCHLALTVILDSSGSVGYEDFQKELMFVRTLLEILAVQAHETGLAVCSGIIRYSTDADVIVNPCCNATLCNVIDKVTDKGIPFVSGSTNTAGALKVARQMLQATASYDKIALLITDGKSNTGGSPITIAKQMREEDNVEIVALGVTDNINHKELVGISGQKDVVTIKGFDDFRKLADALLSSNSMTGYELESDLEAICDTDTYISKNTIIWGNWSDWSECQRYSDPVYYRHGYGGEVTCKKLRTRDCYQCGTAQCEGATEQSQECECGKTLQHPSTSPNPYQRKQPIHFQPQPPGKKPNNRRYRRPIFS